MQRWPLPPDDESVDGDGGGGGGGGGGDGGRGNDDHPDEDMGESFDGTDQTIISCSEVADGSSDDESDDIESDDDVCLGNGEVAQPQQPPNEVVLVESASDNESDDSDDEPDTPPPRGRRIRGGTRMRLRQQQLEIFCVTSKIFLGHTLASRGLSV